MSTRSTRSPRRVATAVGGLSAAVTLVLRLAVFPYPGIAAWELAWTSLGAFVLLAVPGYLYAEYGVVAPVAVVVGSYALAARETWGYFADLTASGAAMSATPTVFSLYLVFWMVPLGVAAAVGGAEYGLRALGARRGGAEA